MSIGNSAVARHEADETIIGVGPAIVTHDQKIFNDETRLVADLGVTKWLALGVIVPFRVFKTSIRYLDDSGNQVQIENPFIHHHNETLTGIADPWLLARGAFGIGGTTFGARLGTTIPLGRTVEDPFVLGDMGLPHEHTQFGTGTLEPVIGLDASRSVGPVHLDAFALTVQSLYTNSKGYKPGDRYAGGLGAASGLGANHWRFRLTGEVQHETAEMWHGIVRTDEGNTGRTDVIAGAEATWRVNDTWHVAATIKVPVYTHVQGGQLDTPFFFGLSVGASTHVFDHDHHATDTPVVPGNWTGLDEQSITDDGSAVPLVPVPGKITVFDFWATWCKPCRVVDHELAEVVRRHPDDIAVRKVNIVDTDSPASEKYVREATLPHLKVYGRDGKLLWEHSAPPLTLTSEVERLVTGDTKLVAVAGAQRIAIEVTDDGYHPTRIEIEHGQPFTLVFTRKSNKTCATDVHFALPDGTHIDEQLPLGQAVEIPLLVEKPGEIIYSCGMNMNHGTIVVK
ncbi:MAG TPA: cupredoxin domain-containing protein [Kofleriaceae bacterium]|jgi:thiol-disulfide isomerase/thioredoxin